MNIEYLKTPLNKYTFFIKPIRDWVENNSSGKVLNLFAGETFLNLDETRVDIDKTMIADYYMDALDFIRTTKMKFDTIILDPPYSYRKSMEMYNGHKASRFNQLKDILYYRLNKDGIVITFGYHSVSMGRRRGFKQEKILLMSHGGAIHDTIAIIEKRMGSECSKAGDGDSKPLWESSILSASAINY